MVAELEVDLDIGIARDESGERRHQNLPAEDGGRLDAQQAGGPIAQPGRGLLRLLQLADRPARTFEEARPSSERRTARVVRWNNFTPTWVSS